MCGMLLTAALCQGRVMMPYFLLCFDRLAFCQQTSFAATQWILMINGL